MSAADGRVAELLDRWLASVELHARYLELDNAAYAKVQDWPKHQRPTKWVVELARARLVELKRQLEDRRGKGDTGFAESLELMAFLTTLLGSEHVERFIPLATGKRPSTEQAEATEPAPAADAKPAAPSKAAEPRKSTGDTTTRQKLAARQKPAAAATPASAPNHGVSAKPQSPPRPKSTQKATALVIADAVRFLSWGREWPQLASSIARLADRPAEPEVLAILREHKAEIEAQARRPPD
jgi:hypothetical protein